MVKLMEQLDLAVELLDDDSPTKARLALILTDNATELMLHDRCDVIVATAQARWNREGAISRKKAAEVLGDRFDPKARFLQTRGELSEDEADFCCMAHRLRNQSYHVGVLYEEICWDVAVEYHRIACDFFVRLRRQWGRVPMSEDDLPEAIRKHMPSGQRFSPVDDDVLGGLAESLSAARPEAVRSLREVLGDDLIDRIDALREGLEYIASYPRETPVAQVVSHIDFWSDPKVQAELEPGVIETRAEEEAFGERLRSVRAAWRPTWSLGSLDRWEQRARAIAQERQPGQAMKRYSKLTDDMKRLETAVWRGVGEVDDDINMRVKEMRMWRD